MRALKIVGWVVGILVVLVAAAGAALWLGGPGAVRWALEHPVSGAFGRDIRIGGNFEVHWGAPTRIVAEDVHVANASWGSAPDMFAAKRLEIELYVRSLLWGPTRIPLVALDGAKLLLETDGKGDKNWQFGGNTAPKKRREFPELQKFVVRDGGLTYRNGETKAESDLAITGLEVDAPDPQSPVTIALDGSFQNEPLGLKGSVGPIAELRDTEKPYPVKLDGRLAQVELTAEGGIKEPLDMAGADLRLSLTGKKLEQLFAALGVPFPAFPDFRSTGELVGGNGKWEMRALTMKAGDSDLEGGVAVDTTGKVPYAKANLTAKKILLADFKGLYGGQPTDRSAPAPHPPDPSGRVIPDTKIEIHKLPGLNADVTFDAARVETLSGAPIERISFGFQLKDGEITLNPWRFHVAKGDVDLNLHFTPFTGPPRLAGQIDVRHVDLHELFKGPSLPKSLKDSAGTVGGFVKVDTTGTTLREFLAHADGDIGLFMQNGQFSELLQELAPINVLGALGVYVVGDRQLPINCLVSRFDVRQGVATATTLLFDTTYTTVVGEGNVNLGGETMYLKLTPYNKRFTAVSLRTPVDVTGTLGKPQYHVETGNLVARLGAAVGLGVLAPPAALLPLIDTGLGEQNACHTAYAAQQAPGNPEPKSGSSQPPAGAARGGQR
jgi:uncharacterized protein involved in outer membrane biogenesis